ncbi:DNA gyrase inhibitor YacG [Granulibacter bethesdensis]|uniref:DNA gyrase inhibitor YacG n=1 Tax=Granulibacter bethesdensis (strain ATCC BAA-1260 / CGDNIH1) TaxID=391165 RepID=Q0BTC7_GRABC|nr:Ribonuclease G [Granulibacter bethesdensis CGDNIH1]APG30610.1 Ribonuclease G [Granulibacter bethesdensis]APH51741.1 Ribonuclease G [Granulibacter bethesdensis]APH59363.1 Ribonuclease G [Granulibacter bethesdensis]APH64433.1 Ribonuclease G [Granulibacter bethesdensis]
MGCSISLSTPDSEDHVAMNASRCPICNKSGSDSTFDHSYMPFCSRRCADVDLGRWLQEDYRIPGPPAEQPESSDDE